MASNRAQRRAAYKKGKRPGETYADQLARERNIKEAIDKAARDETVALESDIKTQRFLWMAVVANHIAFGHAGIRAQRFMTTLDEVREDMEKMAAKDGWEYAVEKLREQCEKITGMEVKQVHEDRMIQARKENEAKGIFFPAEDPEELAKIGFTDASALKTPVWIPATERLPELMVNTFDNGNGERLSYERSDFVLGFDENKAFQIVSYESGPLYQGWRDWRCRDHKITHWMELPDEPEEVSHEAGV